jgi:glucokinase
MDLTRLHGRPLEESVSRRAILARYADPGADVREVAARARAGERRARQVLDEAFHGLGGALGPHCRAFGATLLVVGGAMAASWDLVGPALRAGLGHTPVAVQPCGLGEDAALIGAAHAAVRG